MNAVQAARLLLAAGLAASAAGCVLPGKARTLTTLPIDPNSPIAKDLEDAAKHPGPYPRFAEIPPIPNDIRPQAEWRAAVIDLKHRRAVLDAEVAALPPPATDTESFANDTRGRLPSAAETVAPGPNAPAETEAYGRALRERATPPPPPR